MDLDEWLAFVDDLELLDERFTLRKARLMFDAVCFAKRD